MIISEPFQTFSATDSHLHVSRVGSRTVYPGRFNYWRTRRRLAPTMDCLIALSRLNQQNLQIMIKMGKPASRQAASAAATHDDVKFIGNCHFEDCIRYTSS